MSKVTIRASSGRTLIFFNVFEITKTTATVELSYNKKNGGQAVVIMPWTAIETMYVCEQNNAPQQ